jgi:hypothetical protein
MPNVVVINESAGVSDAQIEAMLPAFGEQWNRDLRPVWNVEPALFAFAPRSRAPPDGAWWVVFFDDSDQADALAYRDLTNEGLPLAKVFVGALLAAEASISVGATHAICEMAVDPWLNSAYQDGAGVFWAGDVCDPVRGDQYGYRIGDVLVTDFVTPGWFGQHHLPLRMDLGRHADSPFQILSDGYAQYFEAREGWLQATGGRVMSAVHGGTAARGSRRERRARQAHERLEASERRWPPPM